MAEQPMKTNYAGNSKKAKEEKPEKKVEAVISGEVEIKKEGMGAKLKSMFFGEDFRNVTRYVIAEVLLPAARNLIVDATTQGIQRAVYGESPRRQRPPQYAGHTSYHTPVRRPSSVMLPDQPPHYSPARPASRRPGQQVILKSRDDAEAVLQAMHMILEQYEVVSVADLYDLINEPSNHTDNKWGWYYLNTAQVRQTRDGYLIDLPEPEAI